MPRPKPKRHCRWTLEPNYEYWLTGCGCNWSFTDGGTPEGNGIKYCHGCGKPVKAIYNKRDVEVSDADHE